MSGFFEFIRPNLWKLSLPLVFVFSWFLASGAIGYEGGSLVFSLVFLPLILPTSFIPKLVSWVNNSFVFNYTGQRLYDNQFEDHPILIMSYLLFYYLISCALYFIAKKARNKLSQKKLSG